MSGWSQCWVYFSLVIRPSIPRPPKKTDPVKRYHEIQKIWENFKPPEEKHRSALRWKVRVCLQGKAHNSIVEQSHCTCNCDNLVCSLEVSLVHLIFAALQSSHFIDCNETLHPICSKLYIPFAMFMHHS